MADTTDERISRNPRVLSLLKPGLVHFQDVGDQPTASEAAPDVSDNDQPTPSADDLMRADIAKMTPENQVAFYEALNDHSKTKAELAMLKKQLSRPKPESESETVGPIETKGDILTAAALADVAERGGPGKLKEMPMRVQKAYAVAVQYIQDKQKAEMREIAQSELNALKVEASKAQGRPGEILQAVSQGYGTLAGEDVTIGKDEAQILAWNDGYGAKLLAAREAKGDSLAEAWEYVCLKVEKAFVNAQAAEDQRKKAATASGFQEGAGHPAPLTTHYGQTEEQLIKAGVAMLARAGGWEKSNRRTR
jgi:hypothetical protein